MLFRSSALAVQTDLELSRLTQPDKLGRIAVLESLLKDFSALPDGRRNSSVEMELNIQLGVLRSMLGVNNDAVKNFELALELAKQFSSKRYEGIILLNLGVAQAPSEKVPLQLNALAKC